MPAADNRMREQTRHTQQVIAVTDVQAERLKKLLGKWTMPDMFDVVDQLLEIGEAYEWVVDDADGGGSLDKKVAEGGRDGA